MQGGDFMVDNNLTNDQNQEQVKEQEQPGKPTKFCKHCGKKIDAEAVLCIHCGLQVEELKSIQAQPQIIVNNANNNTNTNSNTNVNTNVAAPYAGVKPKNKWVAFILCLCLGFFGAHKFYEGKSLLGILYLCTGGLLGIGVVIDLITLLLKPNPYF